MYKKPPFSEIVRKIDISIGNLLKNDNFLFTIDVHERTISHKLAEYLQMQFPDWNVDCEYNRDKHEAKKLIDIHSDCNREKDNVYPDIIIHQRNVLNNLLVIEIKSNEKESICDVKKLQRFTIDQNFNYSFGLFIQFEKADPPHKKWFCKGKIKTEQELLQNELPPHN